MKKLVLMMVAAIGLTGSAYAADNLAVSADIGTTGLGLHLTLPIVKDLNGRIGVNYGSYSYDGSTSNVSYDYKLKTNTFDALLDWHPLSNSFRVTGGLVYNNNKIDATGRPTAAGTYTIQGNTYSTASVGQIDGKVDFRKVAPYIGVGFGNALDTNKSQLTFGGDFGVIYAGSPRTSLSNSGCTAPAATCAQLASDLVAENARLNDKVDSYKIYPVIRFSVNYRF